MSKDEVNKQREYMKDHYRRSVALLRDELAKLDPRITFKDKDILDVQRILERANNFAQVCLQDQCHLERLGAE